MTPLKRHNGFSLIEILIALFVFAIGILTVAGLQIVSKRTNFEAVQRTSATYLAYDIIERMRANPNALDIYVDDVLGEARATPSPMCTAAACDIDELAAFDTWEWQQALSGASEQSAGASTGGLVNPTGCIEGPAIGGQGIYTITIVWQGVDALTNTNDSKCGVTTTLNADGTTSEDNGDYGDALEYRRIIEIATYIAP